MKTKKWIGIIFAFLVILSGCAKFNNRGVVENPAYIARNANNLNIQKIELSDTTTVLYMKVFFTPNNWIRINENSFLTDNQGEQYTILSTEGIVLGEEFIMPESGEKEFSMIFPHIDSDAVSIDFSEGEISGAWKIWGIQLTNKPIKVNLPKGFKDVAIDKNAVLPPVEFKMGKARLEGRILNFCMGMPAELSVMVSFPFEYSPTRINLPIDSNGVFSGEIDAFSAHPVTVNWQGGGSIKCFIASGETTTLIFNPAEKSRRESLLSGDKPSLGEPLYYGGFMASVSKEIADIYLGDRVTQFNSQESYMSFIQSIATKTPEDLKILFLDDYKVKKATIDTLNVSPAAKQILNCGIDLSYAYDITTLTSWLDRAYFYKNQIQNDREARQKYLDTRKHDLPDDFNSVIKDFSINDTNILFVEETALYAYQWQMQNKQSELSKALGTDQGTLFDIMNLIKIYQNIKDFKPLNEEQITQIPAAFQDYIINKNNELLQLIEANKNKTGFTETDIKKVAKEDVFPFILSKFRGKPILIDVWATWCGPCRAANETMKPMKKELEGKDIVYAYLAGEDSPLETWENMIPDLHGEHFRLTKEQHDYFMKTFGIEGVPTYFLIDRKGNISEKFLGYPGNSKMKEVLLKLLSE